MPETPNSADGHVPTSAVPPFTHAVPCKFCGVAIAVGDAVGEAWHESCACDHLWGWNATDPLFFWHGWRCMRCGIVDYTSSRERAPDA